MGGWVGGGWCGCACGCGCRCGCKDGDVWGGGGGMRRDAACCGVLRRHVRRACLLEQQHGLLLGRLRVAVDVGLERELRAHLQQRHVERPLAARVERHVEPQRGLDVLRRLLDELRLGLGPRELEVEHHAQLVLGRADLLEGRGARREDAHRVLVERRLQQRHGDVPRQHAAVRHELRVARAPRRGEALLEILEARDARADHQPRVHVALRRPVGAVVEPLHAHGLAHVARAHACREVGRHGAAVGGVVGEVEEAAIDRLRREREQHVGVLAAAPQLEYRRLHRRRAALSPQRRGELLVDGAHRVDDLVGGGGRGRGGVAQRLRGEQPLQPRLGRVVVAHLLRRPRVLRQHVQLQLQQLLRLAPLLGQPAARAEHRARLLPLARRLHAARKRHAQLQPPARVRLLRHLERLDRGLQHGHQRRRRGRQRHQRPRDVPQVHRAVVHEETVGGAQVGRELQPVLQLRQRGHRAVEQLRGLETVTVRGLHLPQRKVGADEELVLCGPRVQEALEARVRQRHVVHA